MKKIFTRFLLAVLLVCLLASSASAQGFAPSNSDLTISIDTNSWYVFTIDNIENNPEVVEVGFTVEQLRQIFTEEDAVLLALSGYDQDTNLVFEIRKNQEADILNLTPHSDTEIDRLTNDLVKDMRDEYTVNSHSTYQSTYKYIELDYAESDGFRHKAYVTVVNGDNYWFDFYMNEELDSDVLAEAKRIIDSAVFNVENPNAKETTAFKAKNLLYPLIAAAVYAVIRIVIKKVRNRKKDKTDE